MSKFINPYTFFPIEQREPERQDVKDLHGEETLSGYLTCEFDIKSPVFIPNTTKKFRYLGEDGEAKEHFFSEFYSYDDLSGIKNHDIPENPPYAPRIPGSEFRGMVRNLYEQLTNSCLSQIDAKSLPHKRSILLKKAGLLDVTTNILYEGKRLCLNNGVSEAKGIDVSSYNLKTGQIVYVQRNRNIVINLSLKEKDRYMEGYVLIGNSFDTKKYESVIVPKKENNNLVEVGNVSDIDMERFKLLLKKYRENEDNAQNSNDYYDNCYSLLDSDKKIDDSSASPLIPVFYYKVSNPDGKANIYLAPAMYSAEIFSGTIDSLLEKDFKHNKCSGKDGYFCTACRLFGMVGEENSLASRLRFTDSEIINNPLFDEPGLLAVLGTPRISSVEFYLKKPEAYNDKKCISWNYDYNIYSKKDGDKIKYEDVVLNDEKRVAKLRGRKVYWYGRDGFSDQDSVSLIKKLYDDAPDRAEFVKDKRLKLTQAVRAVKSGNSTFNIYFEDISEAELKALIYCLNLGDFAGNNEKLCHRIGRGKPYGMGAIKLKITDLNLAEYKIEDDKVSVNTIFKKEDLSSYILDDGEYKDARKYIEAYSLKLSAADAALVSYPDLEDKPEEIFEWFAYNRGEGKLGNYTISQVLPELMDEDKSLLKKNSEIW